MSLEFSQDRFAGFSGKDRKKTDARRGKREGTNEGKEDEERTRGGNGRGKGEVEYKKGALS